MNTSVSTHWTVQHSSTALEEGSAKVLCNAIICYHEENNISTDEIIAVGCDGTAVNTGVLIFLYWLECSVFVIYCHISEFGEYIMFVYVQTSLILISYP